MNGGGLGLSPQVIEKFGTPGQIRTADLLLRLRRIAAQSPGPGPTGSINGRRTKLASIRPSRWRKDGSTTSLRSSGGPSAPRYVLASGERGQADGGRGAAARRPERASRTATAGYRHAVQDGECGFRGIQNGPALSPRNLRGGTASQKKDSGKTFHKCQKVRASPPDQTYQLVSEPSGRR